MASEPALYLVRHGATEWSQNGRHTSVTDLPLLPSGEERAAALKPVLSAMPFATVLSSPRQRALQTCRLAGFGDRAVTTDDLAEWNYGAYEGLTSPEIHSQRPDWSLWTDGCPDGESPADVTARADRVIAQALAGGGDAILFAHGHILRVVTVRWLELPITAGVRFLLAPATISKLGHEHADRSLEAWNAATL